MIKGVINSKIQSDLSNENLLDYEVLEINYLKKKLFYLMGVKNINVKF